HAAGNGIGNHSWDHPDLTTLPPDQVRSELQSTTDKIASLAGTRPTLWRPPYGYFNDTVTQIASSLGLSMRLWDVNPEDYTLPGADQIVSRVVNKSLPGRSPSSTTALPATTRTGRKLLRRFRSSSTRFDPWAIRSVRWRRPPEQPHPTPRPDPTSRSAGSDAGGRGYCGSVGIGPGGGPAGPVSQGVGGGALARGVPRRR